MESVLHHRLSVVLVQRYQITIIRLQDKIVSGSANDLDEEVILHSVVIPIREQAVITMASKIMEKLVLIVVGEAVEHVDQVVRQTVVTHMGVVVCHAEAEHRIAMIVVVIITIQ